MGDTSVVIVGLDRVGAGFEKEETWLTRDRFACDSRCSLNCVLEEGIEAMPALIATDVCMQRRKGEL